jgi:hypothetical protein
MVGLPTLVEPFEGFSEAKIIEAGATKGIRHCGESGYGTAEVAPASLST